MADEEKTPVKAEKTGKYICPVCGYILKVHTPDEEFRCPLCGCEGKKSEPLPEEEA